MVLNVAVFPLTHSVSAKVGHTKYYKQLLVGESDNKSESGEEWAGGECMRASTTHTLRNSPRPQSLIIQTYIFNHTHPSWLVEVLACNILESILHYILAAYRKPGKQQPHQIFFCGTRYHFCSGFVERVASTPPSSFSF